MLSWLATPLLLLAQPELSPPQMLEDAELAAVTFVDADRGWAVGDRGVIWHTGDGGRTWKLQASGVTCRLEAVQFLGPENGWVVGGWTQPYTHHTQGVVLRTRDGGRTWQNLPGLTLPALKQVKMLDVRRGWALGDSSHLFPPGVFSTTDGGKSWAPLEKGLGEGEGWIAGDFRDHKSGAVASLSGGPGFVAEGEVRPANAPAIGRRYVRRLVLTGEQSGWLIGDGGLVLTTGDGGTSWTGPAGALPEVARQLDFRAVATSGSHVWIAGAPGSCVLHSADGGQSWQKFHTSQTAPLRGLCFLDEYRGWAVGTLGTILHSRDGGKTWRVQKESGGTRTAVLGVFSEPARVPLELVASQGGADGYITAVEIVGRRDGFEARSIHAAVVAAGGSAADAAWQFPLADPGVVQSAESIIARWNRATGERAIEQLEEHLVRRIRQWRPEVIVTEDVSPRGDDPLAHLTNQVTLAAVAKAADASQFAHQISPAGLAAWKVKKVFAVTAGGQQGLVNIVPAPWSRALGRSVAEQAALGRRLLSRDVDAAPINVGLSLLVDHLPHKSGQREVLSGINLSAGSEARRVAPGQPLGNPEELSLRTQKRHNLEQLVTRIDDQNSFVGNWLSQINELTRGLAEEQAAELIWQLARRYEQSGKLDSAADAERLLRERHPQHPLADAAALALVRNYSSSELAWRGRRERRQPMQATTAVTGGHVALPQARTVQSAAAQAAVQAASVQLAGFAGTSGEGSSPPQNQRAGAALAVANEIKQARPALYADPALRFPVAAALRQLGQPQQAERLVQGRAAAAKQLFGPWTAAAAAEYWILHPSQEPPKKVCSAVKAAAKPRLDGRLDDSLWQSAKAVSLLSLPGDEASPPGAIVLAYDDEFLYVAASCPKMPGVDYSADRAPRSADADLRRRDHVTILLDVDRDYASWWRLSFDHRGWPAESCCQDATWNPEWYLAAAGDEHYWTVEAAIPLAELGPKRPEVRDVWAVGLTRTVPCMGLQSFSTPAAAEPRPEGFGLLVFE